MSAGERTTRSSVALSRFSIESASRRDDPVGVRLAQVLCPGAVADVDLARRIALDPSGGSSCSWIQMIDLPSGARDGSSATGWPHDDRRLGREQSALGLVHCARDAVQPGRDVDDRAARRAARRPAPSSAGARPARGGSASRRGRSGSALAASATARGTSSRGEQAAVELGRGDARDDRAGRRHDLAAGKSDPGRPAVETRMRSTSAPGAPRRLRRGRSRRVLRRAARRRPSARACRRAGARCDHLGHEPGCRLVGAEARVETHGASRPWARLRLERVRQPVAAGDERPACELEQSSPAEAPERLAAEVESGARPELGAERPNERSALAMNASNSRSQAAPSPFACRSSSATFASRRRHEGCASRRGTRSRSGDRC